MQDVAYEEALASLEAQANLKCGDILTGTIRDVRTANAGDLFGDKARNPEATLLDVEIEVGNSSFRESFTLPKNPASWKHSLFKLGRYRAKYQKLPHEGDLVEVTVNERGFYQVAL